MTTQRLVVSRAQAGQTIAVLLRKQLRLPWSAVRRLVRSGGVFLAGKPCREPSRRVVAGQRIEVREQERKPARPKPPAAPIVIRHADEHILVVEKPAGLTTMRHPDEAAEFGKRAQRFLPPTLEDLLPDLLDAERHRYRNNRKGKRPEPGRPTVIAVHRLDKETSGLVVFARTREAARHLGRQFREHTIERSYLAVVRGQAKEGRIESRLVRDRGDGRRGSGKSGEEGQRAVTHVRIVESLEDFTLIECRLETGRTHQVRIHLGEAGTPLCGDQLYDRPLHGRPLPDASDSPRIALHAAFLAFDHPATGQCMEWTSPLPEDLAQMVTRLRRG